MNREALRADYNEQREWLENRAIKNLSDLLLDAREEFSRKYRNISPPKYPEVRLKQFAKIVEKVERKEINWAATTIFVEKADGECETIVNDVVAGKLVCATLIDVENLAAILMNWPNQRLSIIEAELKFNPKTGYRSFHIDAKIEVHQGAKRLMFPVEIQIKTLLQDAWANFDHDELYKPSDEPPLVTTEISRHVADALFALDKIGQTIRDEKLRKRPAATEIGNDETLVTHRTLNYLVNQIFHVTMSEVELQKCVEQLRAFDYFSLAEVDALARDTRIAATIEASKAELRIPTELTPYEILYFGPLAAKEGGTGVTSEMRLLYALTNITCDSCKGPISEDDHRFNETQTDLDEVYFCSVCRTSRLKKCKNCEKFTEAEICKDCRSQDVAVEIV